jgi:hypothetical protein
MASPYHFVLVYLAKDDIKELRVARCDIIDGPLSLSERLWLMTLRANESQADGWFDKDYVVLLRRKLDAMTERYTELKHRQGLALGVDEIADGELRLIQLPPVG